MKFESTVIVYYCMSRIISALKSNNHVRFPGKVINYFTFSFIAKLCAYYNFNRHNECLPSSLLSLYPIDKHK